MYLPIVVVSNKVLAHKATVGFIVFSEEKGLSQKDHKKTQGASLNKNSDDTPAPWGTGGYFPNYYVQIFH